MRGTNKLKITQPNLKFTRQPTKRTKTNLIVVHHAAATSCTVEDIHRWHLKRGWIGIGYNYFIPKLGEAVYIGRPDSASGAHTINYNSVSIGICLEGDFTKETISVNQKQKLADLIDYLRKKYPTITNVGGHRDYAPTACPGNFSLENLPAPSSEENSKEESVELLVSQAQELLDRIQVKVKGL